MSNGIKFVLLLSAILVVMFSLAFAQAEPFQAEVLVQTARMRWGPGSAFAVQHYANLGHVLTVLEADAESDPPWTWYYARTASGVQSWIRGDLIRRTDAAVPIEARPDNPTGSYPVIDNNLCNTSLFRACQDGTDHGLWEAGYWANDRYDHWERGGWNLDIVYHQNPCKADRVCTTREQWDEGHQEAQTLAATATPDLTMTPVVIQQTVEVGVREVWTKFNGANLQLTGTGSAASIYTPPSEIRTQDGGSIIGGFRFNSESISVNCKYWHKADRVPATDYVESGLFSVNLARLRVADNTLGTPEERARALADSQVECISGNIAEIDVVARRWQITISRSYSGLGRIGNVSWRLTATFGADEPAEACAENACTKTLSTPLRTYIASEQPTTNPRAPRNLGSAIPASSTTDCGESRMSTENEVTRYEHKCEGSADSLSHTLELKFTHDRGRGFLKPKPTATS